MAAGSRLKAAEQRLVTIIAAQPALAPVAVDRDHPGELLQPEHIFLGRVRFTEGWQSLSASPHKREQDMTVELWVFVRQGGDDSAAIRDRAYDIADEVEEALRADPGLDGAVEFGGVTNGESDTFPSTDGRVAYVQLEATYKARKG